MMLKDCVVSLILTCLFFSQSLCIEENEGTISIELIRQETTFQKWFKEYGNKIQLSGRTNDSIPLYRWLDNEFYALINVGQPGQQMNVAFDTSWSRSWVISSRCNSWKVLGCYFHNKYDHSASSGYKKDGKPYSASDGKYNFTGYYSYDNFSIGQSRVLNQSFIEMTAIPDLYALEKVDGILGLGLQTGDYEPFFYKLLSQNMIRDPIFSIYLNRDINSARGGNLLLGYYNERHIHKSRVGNQTVADPIKYLPVIASQYWQFRMDSVVLNSKDPIKLCENGCNTVIDSSSNNIVGPAEEVAKIHDEIQAEEFLNGRYTVRCDSIGSLPTINFMLGGQNFTLTGNQYIVRMTNGGFTACVSAFMPPDSEAESGIWILGGSFMKEHYTIYNVKDKLIGIVKCA